MVKVLGSTPRVDHVRSGVSQTDRETDAFVEYRYRETAGEFGVVRFAADQAEYSKNPGDFVAILSGLMTPGGPLPPDFGATRIAGLWKSTCHVSAYLLFE